VIVNGTQHVSSINRQTTAKEYRSIQGLAKILKFSTCNTPVQTVINPQV